MYIGKLIFCLLCDEFFYVIGVRVVLVIILWVVVEDLIVVGCSWKIEGLDWEEWRVRVI